MWGKVLKFPSMKTGPVKVPFPWKSADPTRVSPKTSRDTFGLTCSFEPGARNRREGTDRAVLDDLVVAVVDVDLFDVVADEDAVDGGVVLDVEILGVFHVDDSFQVLALDHGVARVEMPRLDRQISQSGEIHGGKPRRGRPGVDGSSDGRDVVPVDGDGISGAVVGDLPFPGEIELAGDDSAALGPDDVLDEAVAQDGRVGAVQVQPFGFDQEPVEADHFEAGLGCGPLLSRIRHGAGREPLQHPDHRMKRETRAPMRGLTWR